MKKIFFGLVFILALGVCSCSKVNYSVDEIISKKYATQNEQVNQFLLDSNFQGAVLVARKNTILFAKGYGPCDSKAPSANPITINTTFEIGSITKEMTAVAVMQLEEQEKLSLKDPLSKYFPDYKYGNDITIELLLNMRSGLTDCINSQENFFPKKVCRQIERNTLINKPLEKNLVLKYFYEAPLLTTPDSTFFYCNTNYYLLAKIIEQVSDKSFEEYLQENIFIPCQMDNTNVLFQQTDTKGYDWRKKYTSIPAELAFGCGDVNSSVVDLYKFTQAFTSCKLVSKKTYRKMIDTSSYGYGVNVQNGEIFHSGITNVFNAHSSYYPAGKMTVIVLCNKPQIELNATSIARGVYKAFEK